MTLVLPILAGLLIGLSLGALGGGGAILAVPVLVYALGQSPAQATTGSLLVVGATALIGAITAHRAGHVLLGRGVTFGLVAIGGAAAGAKMSALVPQAVLLAMFAVLMLVVGGLMAVRQVIARRKTRRHHAGAAGTGTGHRRLPTLDDPIITFSPTFACRCPQALKVLIAATAVGLLTGFLGVGGGFVVVPALMLALALPIDSAAGTSLVVITVTSATALAIRSGTGVAPDWNLVLVLTVAAAIGGFVGAKLPERIDTSRLTAAFTALVLGVAVFTGLQALPALA